MHCPHGPGNPFPHCPQSSNNAPSLPCHSPAMRRASHKEGAPPSRSPSCEMGHTHTRPGCALCAPAGGEAVCERCCGYPDRTFKAGLRCSEPSAWGRFAGGLPTQGQLTNFLGLSVQWSDDLAGLCNACAPASLSRELSVAQDLFGS